MKIKYELKENSSGQIVVVKTDENGLNVSFMADPANSDYQEYLASLNDTNKL